jgi:hypothetical protein
MEDEPLHTDQLNGAKVAKTQIEKDIIIVLIDQRLSFEDHMHAKINKANSILGVTLRTMEYKDASSLLTLYKALVQPQLEYCNQVWSPHMVKDITVFIRLTTPAPLNTPLAFFQLASLVPHLIAQGSSTRWWRLIEQQCFNFYMAMSTFNLYYARRKCRSLVAGCWVHR